MIRTITLMTPKDWEKVIAEVGSERQVMFPFNVTLSYFYDPMTSELIVMVPLDLAKRVLAESQVCDAWSATESYADS